MIIIKSPKRSTPSFPAIQIIYTSIINAYLAIYFTSSCGTIVAPFNAPIFVVPKILESSCNAGMSSSGPRTFNMFGETSSRIYLVYMDVKFPVQTTPVNKAGSNFAAKRYGIAHAREGMNKSPVIRIVYAILNQT